MRWRGNTIVLFLVVIIFLLSPAYGQKIWEKKSYKQWTAAETEKILLDSPWAQTAFQTTRSAYNVPGISISAIIRLRSALPIRQALVRRRQLVVNYDRLSSTAQAKFDAETREFLECPDCAKYYIVTLVSGIPAGAPLSGVGTLQGSEGFDIVSPLKGMSLENLKPYVHLSNDKGEQRVLVGFVPPTRDGGEAMFVFERFDNQGKPLVTTSHKKVHFKIDEHVFKSMAAPLKMFTFQVSQLVQKSEVIF